MVEKVFETWSKQVYDQDVVQTLLAKVIDIRDASFCKSGKFFPVLDIARGLTASNQYFVGAIFIPELGSIALPWFLCLLEGPRRTTTTNTTYKLDSHLLVVQKIRAFKDDTERSFPDLLPHSVVDAHYIRRGGRHV